MDIRHTLEIAIYVLKTTTQPQLLSGTVKDPNILVQSVSEATCITPRLVGGKKIYDIEASFQGHLFTGREEFFIVTKKQASVFTQQIILIFVSNQSYFINFFFKVLNLVLHKKAEKAFSLIGSFEQIVPNKHIEAVRLLDIQSWQDYFTFK